MKTPLAIQMIARADADGLPSDHPVRTKAIEFEKRAEAAYSKNPPEGAAKSILGAWARARLAWRDYSGESLI